MNKHAYLRNSPAGCIDSADVLLILDSGDKLPVHSAFLITQSEVFQELLTSTKCEGQRRLPLQECPREDAIVLLQYLHAADKGKLFSSDILNAKKLASLAHKYSMKSILKHCDEVLAAHVAKRTRAVSSSDRTLVRQQEWSFLHIDYLTWWQTIT